MVSSNGPLLAVHYGMLIASESAVHIGHQHNTHNIERALFIVHT